MVDILLPCRNAAHSLSACLKSIATQKDVSWHLVAVDDGSTDETPSILASFAHEHPATTLLSSKKRGLVEALNLGLKHARTPYVARMDADDRMHPQRLASQVNYLSTHPDTGVVGCRVSEDDLDPGFINYLQWSNGLLSHEAIQTARFIESPLVHPSVCFRRQLIRMHGDYHEGSFPEDYELWLRWLDAGVRFFKLDKTLLTWTDHPTRLTRTDPRYQAEGFYEVKGRYLVRWLEQYSPQGRRVWVWGAGYQTRKRLRILRGYGIEVEAFVDVDQRKIGTTNQDGHVLSPDALPGPETCFVLTAVGTRGARERIARDLVARGYREGVSFLAVA